MIYQKGTVSIKSGEVKLIGNKTNWTSNKAGIAAGQLITISTPTGAFFNVVKSVNSDTEITLAFAAVTSAEEGNYVISTTLPDTVSDGVRKISATNAYLVQLIQNISDWQNGSGEIEITMPDGEVITLIALKDMSQALTYVDFEHLKSVVEQMKKETAQSKSHAESSQASATSSAISATTADEHAKKACECATRASQSEVNAKASAASAAAKATEASTSAASASAEAKAAKASQEAAEASKVAAKASQDAASKSATAASTSSTEAKASAAAAKASETKSISEASRAKKEADRAEQTADGLTIIATDGYRKAVEHNSGGRNTVIYDAQGNPNIMCVIPRFNIEDLELTELDLGAGVHPAFVTNGAPRGEILVGKYLASSAAGGSAVIGGPQPRTSVNYDAAKQLCTQKGDNWHLMSIHEWAAIALWSLANGTVPRGNTNYGRSHEAKWETARRADNGLPGDTSGTGRTDTGKGPATWNHDHTEFGVCDLVGNVWEWIDQMKLDDGQILTTLDNNPAVAEANWHRHPAYFDSTSDNQSGAGNNGSPVLSNSVTKRNGPADDDSHNYPNMYNPYFAAITKSVGYTPNELLRRLLIESATPTTVGGGLWCRNYGDRFPRRGGSWGHGSGAGLGALDLNGARSSSDSDFGFRPAFFV